MPHRVGHLWEAIGTFENVERAWGVYNQHRPAKLYKKLNHRNFRNIDKFIADPTPRLARGLMSRYGWLVEVDREHILSDAVPLDYVKGKAK